MAQFIPRLTRPEAGNKYYITKGNGGYSNAIKGSPTDPLCDVLSNCVGYAYGRFNEIGGYGCCKYLSPTNAENFIQNSGGLAVGQSPKLGACMVWRKGNTLSGSDGAGHVAIVEKIISDTQIVTSESGWGSAPFWTKTRYKGSGNWGEGSGYTFLGFIYNPAVEDDSAAPGNMVAPDTAEDSTSNFNTSVPSEPLKFEVGDIVEYTGSIHFTNALARSGLSCRPGKVKITIRYPNGFHQYHVVAVAGGGSTAHGWVDADKIKPCDGAEVEAAPSAKEEVAAYTTGSSNEQTIFNFCRQILGLNVAAAVGVVINIINESNCNPTAVGDGGTSYGICQWHNTRNTALRNWCNQNGKNYSTLDGQLWYMKHELEKSYSAVLSYIKAVENTAEGAYNAAYRWCLRYEIPANTVATSERRGALARDTYWTKYSGATSNATGITNSGSTTGSKTHTVVSGDTLWGISRKYGTTIAKLAKANNIKNVNLIHVGQVLTIPE